MPTAFPANSTLTLNNDKKELVEANAIGGSLPIQLSAAYAATLTTGNTMPLQYVVVLCRNCVTSTTRPSKAS